VGVLFFFGAVGCGGVGVGVGGGGGGGTALITAPHL